MHDIEFVEDNDDHRKDPLVYAKTVSEGSIYFYQRRIRSLSQLKREKPRYSVQLIQFIASKTQRQQKPVTPSGKKNRSFSRQRRFKASVILL